MKRIMRFQDEFNNHKYIIQKEYYGFGVYEEMCPSGYYKHQSWMISDNEGNDIVIQSFNNICMEEILDMIDSFNETGKFGIKTVNHCNQLCMHPNGKIIV